ncbi:methyl-accepting chemotaxis protein [Microbacterium sp. ARD31]|uniref:methyl-accepting chemotaxis protein n=1 Tax=Microbacterium sp. ARD31 TaxID=2962576 RepID=UPI0028813FCE|nr:methyl-accepting chemotaxis protein [Microbacterium sp. ARD31]MDT0187321.1 methyl-accepting chemotaxis protein [Microbacterium sp. ARD31]
MSRLGRADRDAQRQEAEVYREVVAQWLAVCRAAASGDLEARAMAVPGSEGMADVAALRSALNLLLDRTDAYVRESAASLEAASDGRFHRQFLLNGMSGSFRTGATTINRAAGHMAEAQRDLDVAAAARQELANRLEDTVMSVAEQVAAAATELGATAAGLSESAHHAVGQADAAGTTSSRLDDAAREIQDVVRVISQIAAQTQLLALNATIEAARAGEAGRGFAVVATEVKSLADTTAASAERVVGQVRMMQDVVAASTAAMGDVGGTVREMSPMVDAVRTAVDGQLRGSSEAFDAPAQGLAHMAELLREEVGTFLAVMREDA